MMTNNELPEKVKKVLSSPKWYHATTMASYNNILREGIIYDYNRYGELDFGFGFYLTPSKKLAESYMIPPAKPQLFYLLPSSILQKKKKLEKNRVLDGIIREIYIILYSISRNIRKMGRLPP